MIGDVGIENFGLEQNLKDRKEKHEKHMLLESEPLEEDWSEDIHRKEAKDLSLKLEKQKSVEIKQSYHIKNEKKLERKQHQGRLHKLNEQPISSDKLPKKEGKSWKAAEKQSRAAFTDAIINEVWDTFDKCKTGMLDKAHAFDFVMACAARAEEL